MKFFKKSICLLLISVMLILVSGCAGYNAETQVVNLSENIQPTQVKRQKLSDDFISAQQNFALELFSKELKNHQGNLNISPYSLSFALSIIADGAKGDTLSQIEAVLMNSMSKEEWNNNMHSYQQLNKSHLSAADSLWILKNKSNVKEEFLQNTLGYFDAFVYYTNSDSQKAVDEINNWAKEKTQGKIHSVVDNLEVNTVMYLANTVYMDIPWATTHLASEVKEELFTSANGEKSKVKMMYSTLSANQQTYISDENAEGFIKVCAGDYKFVALMPNENIDIYDYIASLNSTKLRNILSSGEKVTLKTGMPEFTIESNINFRETLLEMGVTNAYNGNNADFSGILDNGGLYLGKTSQKTYINVDIGGIRATSATGQEAILCSPIQSEEKQVILNRPFVYIITDKHSIPVFIGVVAKL